MAKQDLNLSQGLGVKMGACLSAAVPQMGCEAMGQQGLVACQACHQLQLATAAARPADTLHAENSDAVPNSSCRLPSKRICAS